MRRRFVQSLLCIFMVITLTRPTFAYETNLILAIDGTVYSNVTWGTVTPATVTMFHKTGISVVPIEKLPDAWQKHFNYDPQKAVAYRVQALGTQAPSATGLGRAATTEALAAATRPAGMFKTFEMEAETDDVEGVRNRYRQLIDLQKSGHPDYRAATDLLVVACRRAIDRHYELKKERPEYRDAARNFNNFRNGPDVLVNNTIRQDLYSKKVTADAYYQRLARLLDEARKAWNDGVSQKTMIDNKIHPPPPPPPKHAVTDPYLQETP